MRTRIIILAAGKGTRMNNGEMPKVLIPFEGKPMIMHLLDAVRASGVDARPVMVTGYQAEMVERTLGGGYDYVRQDEQLGTGHAVQCAEKLLAGKTDQIMVLYGDHPFVTASTIMKLRAVHEQAHCTLSMITVPIDDFDEWRAPFADFGRVVRDASGKIAAVVEVKDATPEQRIIREVTPAFFCFDAAWLWPHLKLLTNHNAKSEYYLTDLVGMAIRKGACVASMTINPLESIGINTPAHLETAQRTVSQ